MKAVFLFLSFFFSVSLPAPRIDKEEAQKAFLLLNRIRSNPGSFTDEMPFLAEIGKKPLLKWNDTLAKVAEAKALDMATRKYVAHVDPDGYGLNYKINEAGYKLNAKWLASKEMNYFESISAGASSGEQAIRNLVIDKDVPTLGHRKHLLGLDQWTADMYDIGIGYAHPDQSQPYKSYVCVIIAKHNW